jgi:hypothetical protein
MTDDRSRAITFSPARIEFIGIVISRNRRHPHNTHLAILYRQAPDELRIVEMAMHHDIRHGAGLKFLHVLRQYGYDVACATPDVPVPIARFLAAFCWLIGENEHRNEVPYAFQDDPEMVYQLSGAPGDFREHTGLTCATFVLKVFQSVGIRPIDRSGWAITDEGRAAQLRVAQYLRQRGDEEQAQIVESEAARGVPRIAPEHVVGAFLEDERDWPVGYEKCAANAGFVEKLFVWLSALNPLLWAWFGDAANP